MGQKEKMELITVEFEKENDRRIGMTCIGEKRGVIITRLTGVAKSWGILEPGDRVESVNGREVMQKQELAEILQKSIGKVIMTVEREKVTLFQKRRSQEEESRGDERLLVLKTEWREKEPLGIELDEQLGVSCVKRGTVFHGRIREGDLIYSVSGERVTTTNQFYSRILTAYPILKIGILDRKGTPRDEEDGEDTQTQFQQISLQISGRMYTRDSLSIQQSDDRIFVSKVEPETDNGLKLHDELLAINGMFLSDKDAALDCITTTPSTKQIEILLNRPSSSSTLGPTETSPLTESESEENISDTEKESCGTSQKRVSKRSVKLTWSKSKKRFEISYLGKYLEQRGLEVGDPVSTLNGIELSLKESHSQAEPRSPEEPVKMMVEESNLPELELSDVSEESSSEESEEDEMVSVRMAYEAGEALGVTVSDALLVTKIQRGTASEGRLHLGDILDSVNGRHLADKDHFYDLLKFIDGTLELTVSRNPSRRKEMESKIFPDKLESLLQRRDGYEYLLLTVKQTEGRSGPGFRLRNRGNQVIVTHISRHRGTGDNSLKKYDRICAINNVAVSDRKVARQLTCLRNPSGHFEALVERPTAMQIIEQMKRDDEERASLDAERRMAKLPPLPPDAAEIGQRELMRRRQKPDSLAPPCLITGPSPSSRNIQVSDGHREVRIVSDVDPSKTLKKIPRPQPQDPHS